MQKALSACFSTSFGVLTADSGLRWNKPQRMVLVAAWPGAAAGPFWTDARNIERETTL
jgi:hypothetical protein